MSLEPLRSNQPAVKGGPPLDGDLYRWLASIRSAIENAVPPGTIKWANLSAADIAAHFDSGRGKNPGPWARWAICNGSNGTPNLSGRFVRASTAAAGATGGSDSSAHTHAIDHDHGAVTSGAGTAHSHGAVDAANGSLRARINIVDGATDLFLDRGSTNFTADTVAVVTSSTTSAASQTAGTIVAGATASESAHTHSVDVAAFTGSSGAASVTENRPAYHELVPLMRLGDA